MCFIFVELFSFWCASSTSSRQHVCVYVAFHSKHILQCIALSSAVWKAFSCLNILSNPNTYISYRQFVYNFRQKLYFLCFILWLLPRRNGKMCIFPFFAMAQDFSKDVLYARAIFVCDSRKARKREKKKFFVCLKIWGEFLIDSTFFNQYDLLRVNKTDPDAHFLLWTMWAEKIRFDNELKRKRKRKKRGKNQELLPDFLDTNYTYIAMMKWIPRCSKNYLIEMRTSESSD